MQKGFGLIGILIAVALVIVAGAAWYTLDSWKPDTGGGLEDDVVAGICPTDAMQCPDGSYVGRTGPNCEFAPCAVLEVEQNQKNVEIKDAQVGQNHKDQEVKNVEVDDRYNIDTSSWKIYRNEEYGFEVKYPSAWTVESEFTSEPAVAPTLVSRKFSDPKNPSQFLIVVVYPKETAPVFDTTSGHDINFPDGNGKGIQYGAHSLFFLTKTNKYVIQLLGGHENYKNEDFSAILSTFKFIK